MASCLYTPNSRLKGRDQIRGLKPLEQFVAGYCAILSQPGLSSIERDARTAHLSHLMYLAMTHPWKAVLTFHSHCLLEIERCVLKWGDSFGHLESIALSSAVSKPKPSNMHSSQSTQSPTPIYCPDFQKGSCSHPDSHNGQYKGQRRFLQHVCHACYHNGRPSERHAKNSDTCPCKSQ